MIWTRAVHLHMLAGWRERDSLVMPVGSFFSATSFFASGVVYLPISPRYSIPIFFFSFYISYVVVGYGIVPRWLVYLCIGCALSPLPSAPTASSHLFFVYCSIPTRFLLFCVCV